MPGFRCCRPPTPLVLILRVGPRQRSTLKGFALTVASQNRIYRYATSCISALGHKRTCAPQNVMSALHSNADIAVQNWQVLRVVALYLLAYMMFAEGAQRQSGN